MREAKLSTMPAIPIAIDKRHQAGGGLGVARADRGQALEDDGERRGEADKGCNDARRNRLRNGT